MNHYERRIEKLETALQDLLDDLAHLEGSGPFVISHQFCQVNRKRAQALLAIEPDWDEVAA